MINSWVTIKSVLSALSSDYKFAEYRLNSERYYEIQKYGASVGFTKRCIDDNQLDILISALENLELQNKLNKKESNKFTEVALKSGENPLFPLNYHRPDIVKIPKSCMIAKDESGEYTVEFIETDSFLVKIPLLNISKSEIDYLCYKLNMAEKEKNKGVRRERINRVMVTKNGLTGLAVLL